MFVKRVLIVLTVFAVIFLSVTVGYAEEGAALSQVCAWEQNIDVYITGNMNLGSLNCKISNQTAEIIESGSLADNGVTVRTTILVDISKSMPLAIRDDVLRYIDMLIKNIKENEQYKIVVFGEQLNILQDFTSDRYDLSKAADQIEFSGQQSMIYDAVYNTMPEIQPLNGMPCYYRTILITDGIDDTVSGITKEELYLKLQTNVYPVDVVAVSKSKQTDPDKELSALTRISGGKYINLYPDSELNTVFSEFSVDDVLWLRAVVPGMLLDGSTRQIDISDGIVLLQFDTKFPVVDLQDTETAALAERENTEIYDEAETSDMEEITVQEDIGLQDGQLIMLSVCAGIGVISMVVLIIALSVLRRGKKKQVNESPQKKCTDSDDETVIITDNVYHVNLYNADNTSQCWNLSLSENIVIGRDEKSQVCLNDKSVSHQQCILRLEQGVPVVENISKSNITRVNGEAISGPHMIRERDKIECGRVVLLVGLIYTAHLGNADQLNKMTEYVNL